MKATPKQRPATGRSRGFTLLELLFVVMIIVILVTVLVPVGWKLVQRASETKCRANLKNVFAAFLEYSDSFKGYVPYGGGLEEEADHPFQCMHEYLGNTDILVCPDDPNEGANFDWQGLLHPDIENCSYTWSADLLQFPVKRRNIQKNISLVMIVDGGTATNYNNRAEQGDWTVIKPDMSSKTRKSAGQWVHSGKYVNVLYANGEVKRVDINELATLRSDPRDPNPPGTEEEE